MLLLSNICNYVTVWQVDKCEQQQHEDLRVSSKRMRQEQEKELKSFRYLIHYPRMERYALNDKSYYRDGEKK